MVVVFLETDVWNVLSSIFLLLILGIVSSDVFTEMLLISDDFENTVQISALDKTNWIKIQLFNDDSVDLFLF